MSKVCCCCLRHRWWWKKEILQDVRMMINENENENKQRKIKSMWQVILHEFKKKLWVGFSSHCVLIFLNLYSAFVILCQYVRSSNEIEILIGSEKFFFFIHVYCWNFLRLMHRILYELYIPIRFAFNSLQLKEFWELIKGIGLKKNTFTKINMVHTLI